MADQLRYDCMRVHGNQLIQTPHLDALAAESADMRNCFVQAPVCVPSRQTYFTGRYPHSHKNRVNYTPLDEREILMQARLKAAGYDTAFVGKLHYWPPTREHGLKSGFNHGRIHDAADTDQWSDYYCWLKEQAPEYAADYRACMPTPQSNPFTSRIPQEYHETTWCGQETRRMLKERLSKDKPFFLFSSYWRPHSPFEVPEPWASMYNDADIPLPQEETLTTLGRLPLPVQRLIFREPRPAHEIDRETLQWMYRSYYASVSQIDHEVGLTLQTLDELGLKEQTIVVFVSDHGDFLGEHGIMGKNAFYDSAVHVPLMIRYPGHVKPSAYQDLVESTDFLSTIFDLIGLEVPYSNQGRSYARLISGGRIGAAYRERSCVFAENIIPEVINDAEHDYPYIQGKGVGGIEHPDAKMIRTERWKYVYYVGYGEELYDLENDPEEKTNIAGDSRFLHQVREFRDTLLDWLITADESDQIAPRWML
ncbi:MAG: sulfatase-like hydrolase/transferase [Spirochaetia bacterium]|nr:sulfatase-like hydrolase/transferase [Spirochaetia bacterium]